MTEFPFMVNYHLIHATVTFERPSMENNVFVLFFQQDGVAEANWVMLTCIILNNLYICQI